jgi:hypothetical protein
MFVVIKTEYNLWTVFDSKNRAIKDFDNYCVAQEYCDELNCIND